MLGTSPVCLLEEGVYLGAGCGTVLPSPTTGAVPRCQDVQVRWEVGMAVGFLSFCSHLSTC